MQTTHDVQGKAPAGPVLTAAQVAERWGLAVSTIHQMWRNGHMPEPFNAGMRKGFRWSLAAIEAHEAQRAVAS